MPSRRNALSMNDLTWAVTPVAIGSMLRAAPEAIVRIKSSIENSVSRGSAHMHASPEHQLFPVISDSRNQKNLS